MNSEETKKHTAEQIFKELRLKLNRGVIATHYWIEIDEFDRIEKRFCK